MEVNSILILLMLLYLIYIFQYIDKHGVSFQKFIHIYSLSDNLHAICHTGDEKEHLKVTLLRIDSTLQGVLSCLPDFRPSSSNVMVEDPDHTSFLIAGATGSSVGSTQLREKAAEIIHAACK